MTYVHLPSCEPIRSASEVILAAVFRFFYDFHSCSIAGQHIAVLSFCCCGLENLDEKEFVFPYAKFECFDF